ncbi:hypothetical protein VMCG_04574 [Cytospora schulzeri]|uniref:Uncharacterized protein n=1 Tax=Cytospora schulzeri TaxID=448051 RepID=A0A423WRU2_9PEZI|nr:hypothetical protein VMCG_04574 [Valsa malicola]
MQLFKRSKKPDQAANPPLDSSITVAPHPDSNPTTTGAEVESEKSPIGLTRTRTEDIVYPSGLKLTLLMVSVFVSMFLVALTFQAPNLAAQTVLPTQDVPIGTSLMLFSQLLSGAIFISIGQNVLDNELLENLAGIPGFDSSAILDSGATTITALPEPLKSVVLVVYNNALRRVFQVGLVMTCLTIFGAAAMEWRSVKKNDTAVRSGQDKETSVTAPSG